MIKKSLKLFLLGTSVLLASCVDDTYDLANKELLTDVKIEGNRLALPLGSLRAIMLDSLISTEEMDFLDVTDGIYSVNMSDSILLEVEVDPIKISIAPQQNQTEIEFVEVDIKEVDIKGMDVEPASFDVPNVSLDDLNSQLPDLSSSVSASLVTDEMRTIFEAIKSDMPLYFTPKYEFKSLAFGLADDVPCSMSYTLPEQIRTITTIKLANRDEGTNATEGSLIQFKVTNPEVLADVTKSISFSVEFPEIFKLSLDNSTYGNDKYTLVNEHVLKVNGLVAEGNLTTIQFYIDELDGLEEYINSETGTLSMNEEIKYEVEYVLDGEITLSKETNLEDFEFSVDMNLPLGFRDVKGQTNDIKINFEPIHMPFQAHFDNLEHIERIDSIMFNAQNSVLVFDTEMDGGFSPFFMKEGHALKLTFPEELIIDEGLSVYPTKGEAQPGVVYDADEHAFYIYDLEVFSQAHWELALDRLILEEYVENDILDIDVKASVSAVDAQKNEVDYLELAAVELESLNTTLDNLKQKEATFVMNDSHLEILNAVVHTEKIIAPLNTYASFALNEEVPQELGRIESIGFAEDIPVCIDLKIDGLEKLETSVHLDLHVALPSFLKLESSNQDVVVKSDSLFVEADYLPNQKEPLSIELLCTGLDFMGEEFNNQGLLIKDSTNGKSYLSYNGDIAILGEASIDGMDFHSQSLEDMKNIIVDATISIGDIEVKNFSGLYRGEFERIEESIELDFVDELSFLKDENNHITLAEPQIIIAFDNTIGVPVDVDLQLVGKDENGCVIETSRISHVFHIDEATYDESTGAIIPKQTKLFITSDTSRVSKLGYKNVEIPNLASLLERLPNSIDLSVLPIIDQNVSHHVDLSQGLKSSGEYSIIIPLKFDEFNMCYSDTISDLQANMSEALEMFSNISLAARMNVTNTLPLGLSLSANVLDKNDNVIDEITIDSLQIYAGDGSNILECDNAQKVELKIVSASGDLSAMDKLAFVVEATANKTEGGVALKKEQGIQLSDIVIEISGDIDTNFTEN